ncbi:MAG TPA: hypothetical protein VMQ54_04065 [Steroidobacteraceae bacterium]|jgi:hypothetical protein|nr:hypothetical protein [Steroidobacteraceae bacterium]
MRALLPTTTACLFLSCLAGSFAGAPAPAGDPVTGTSAPAAPAPTAPTAPAATAIPAAGTSTDGDAAAKHAKRTACLKDAKAQKLVGAKKTAFVKDCVAGP